MELRKENNTIGDQMMIKKLSSGMKCYIIPKDGYGEKMAALCVRFGSNDIFYRNPTEELRHILPRGTAHFIEHTLFAQKWGDAFTAFGKNGASVNAFTDFQKTVYYFSCQENFEENLKLLLDFVQHPYFTQDATEKEKKIIASEINMYEDDPSWKVFFQMLEGMYQQHTVKQPIAGTVKSIEEIDEITLDRAYKAFYTPENFALICVGDVDSKKILEWAETIVIPRNGHRAVSLFDKEQEQVADRYKISDMGLEQPMFQIGFKQKMPEEGKKLKQIYAMRMALDIIAGESSDFFQKAYETGLLEEPLDIAYTFGEGYAFTSFFGIGKKGEALAKGLWQEIETFQQKGLLEEVFERTKRKWLGRSIRGFQSVEAICMSQVELAIHNKDLLDGFQVLNHIKKEEVQRIFQKEFAESAMTLSIVT